MSRATITDVDLCEKRVMHVNECAPMGVCNICGGPTYIAGAKECDECFYGMRMAPGEWSKRLAARGIKVKRTGGCMPFSGGFICSNPYSRDRETEERER